MTKEEYEEMRNTIDSVGKYFNSIEELTIIRDLVEEVDASNEMAILVSPVKLDISLQGISSDETKTSPSISMQKQSSTSEMLSSED